MVGALIKYGTIAAVGATLLFGIKTPGKENTLGSIECGSGENNSISVFQPGTVHFREGAVRAGAVQFAVPLLWGIPVSDLGVGNVSETTNYNLLSEGPLNNDIGSTTVFELTRESGDWTTPDTHVGWLELRREGPHAYRLACKER